MDPSRWLCRCGRCGKDGQLVSRTTYQRHSNSTDSRSIIPPLLPSSSPPPIPTDAVHSGNNSSPAPAAPLDSITGPRVSQADSTGHIRRLLSQKRANFVFPSSLVFAVPPTKDSNQYQPRVDSQLSLLNSYNPLSLGDDDSAAVVSYEYLLIEYLGVLNVCPPQDGYTSASEVEVTKDEILDALRYLDRGKGNEWNKQLRAQLDRDTFIITGKEQDAR
jgi:hypothetical protein